MRLFTFKQAGERIQLSVDEVRREVKAGHIPAVSRPTCRSKKKPRRFIVDADLDAYIEKLRGEPGDARAVQPLRMTPKRSSALEQELSRAKRYA